VLAQPGTLRAGLEAGIASAASAPAVGLACQGSGLSWRGKINKFKEKDFLLCPFSPIHAYISSPRQLVSCLHKAASHRAGCFLVRSIRFTCNGKHTSGTAGRCLASVKMAPEKTGEGCWFSPSGKQKRQYHTSWFAANASRRASLHAVCNVGRFGMNEAFFGF